MRVRIVGPGRAGRSFAEALRVAGVAVELLDRHAQLSGVAAGVDAVMVATPDRVIESVAQMIEPADAALVHCSGASPLGVLSPHLRRASVHPLMSLPDREVGARRLRSGGWFAVAGDPIATELVEILGGRHFVVADGDRVLYHAAAAVSANHLVALLAQVERLAATVNVPVDAFLDLARGSFDDVVARGAAAALTGPAARGDLEVIDAHRAVLPAAERALYDALAAAAVALARPGAEPIAPKSSTEE